MLRFIKALLPHLILTVLGLVGGVVVGLLFDVQILRDGGMGPAAAHAGAFVVFLLAAVPALLGVLAGYAGLALSLVVTLLWDVLRRRWLRRTTVRLLTLAGGAWPWIDFLRSTPPDGGWTILHYLLILLLSLVFAGAGFLSGLLLARFLPRTARPLAAPAP